MYKVINQKTKGMWRGLAYAGLGVFALLCYENAFAGDQQPITGTITVNFSNLPQGWSMRQVAGPNSPTMISPNQMWTNQYSLAIGTTMGFNRIYDETDIATTKAIWVVFIYDEHGNRQGSFKYGAELSNNCTTSSMGVGPLYENDGVVSFGGYSINTDPNSTLVSWGDSCNYTGQSTVDLTYNFIIK